MLNFKDVKDLIPTNKLKVFTIKKLDFNQTLLIAKKLQEEYETLCKNFAIALFKNNIKTLRITAIEIAKYREYLQTERIK